MAVSSTILTSWLDTEAATGQHPRMYRALRSQVFVASGPPVAAERLHLDASTGRHSHDFLELAVVVGGGAVHVSSTGTHQLGRGSVLALRPGDWHGFADCRGLDIYNVYVGLEVFRRELSWLRDDGLGAGLISPSAGGGPRLGQLGAGELAAVVEPLQRLAGEPVGHVSGEPGAVRGVGSLDQTVRVGYLLVVLGQLLPALGVALPAPGGPPLTHPAVRAATRLLEEVPEQRWTLRALAEEVHVSPSYLARLFQRQLGLPPLTYLARLRAERAAALLIETDRSVAEVGRLVGWDDPNYMSRRFHQFFAMAPAAYRASFRPDQNG